MATAAAWSTRPLSVRPLRPVWDRASRASRLVPHSSWKSRVTPAAVSLVRQAAHARGGCALRPVGVRGQAQHHAVGFFLRQQCLDGLRVLERPLRVQGDEGCASIPAWSLTATPMRLLPTSSASSRLPCSTHHPGFIEPDRRASSRSRSSGSLQQVLHALQALLGLAHPDIVGLVRRAMLMVVS